MTLKFCDSYDFYNAADLSDRYNAVAGSPVISTDYGRNGTNGIKIIASPTFTYGLSDEDQATYIVGFAFYTEESDVHTLIRFMSGTDIQFTLTIESGTIKVYRRYTELGSVGGAWSLNTWHYLELKVFINDTGSYEVHIDGINVLSDSSVDTQYYSPIANSIQFGADNGGLYMDDLYICDDAGNYNKDFLGDIRVVALAPNAAGDLSQWTPTSGDNYTCVDEIPPNDDTDYVYTSGTGNDDLYNLASVGILGTVLGVQGNVYARKDDAGSGTVKLLCKSDGVTSSGTEQGIADTYLFYSEVWERDPSDDGAWDIATVDTAQLGIRLES